MKRGMVQRGFLNDIAIVKPTTESVLRHYEFDSTMIRGRIYHSSFIVDNSFYALFGLSKGGTL